jgi:hypothetical protein
MRIEIAVAVSILYTFVVLKRLIFDSDCLIVMRCGGSGVVGLLCGSDGLGVLGCDVGLRQQLPALIYDLRA